MAAAKTNQTRVILWGVPRCVSTTFLKCLTFVEDSVCWYEPYLQAQLFGTDGSITPFLKEILSQMKDQMPPLDDSSQLLLGDNLYEASKHSLSWVRERLEEEYPGKKLIFIKDMVQGIDGHYNALPTGYRHTFLIRHPLKVFASLKKMWAPMPGPKRKLQEMIPFMPPGYYFKEMYDLVEYVKKEQEPEPIIIDADDLLANTPRMMRAYCDTLGIPFNDSLLTWPTGHEVVLTKWITGKDGLVIGIQLVHKSTFESAEFGKPTPIPNPDELPEDVVEVASLSMQYYDKLYEQRFQC
ncbi:uncharacterized protein [Amphiura filiformis]|uniref:uncharacterized protein n=1 Tax=Amphiura filiformis TaxID=82378 RepID=UPI003B20B895